MASVASSGLKVLGAAANTQAISQFANSLGGQMAFGGLVGGVTSAALGGNFWEGLATGAVVSGLNHGLHKLADGNGKNPNLPQELPDEKLYETPIRKDVAVIDPILMPGSAPVKGLKWMASMAKKPSFVSSTFKKIGNYWEFSVKNSGTKGSFTVYKKYINAEGRTLKMFHDTYDKTYKFLHREFMNGQERIKIYYDGTREWFSKWGGL